MFLSGNINEYSSILIYSIVLGFLITLALIPAIVYIARRMNILYWPEKRSSHLAPTPALGGIAIYIGFIIPYILFSEAGPYEKIMLASSSTLIFILGLIDDLKKMKPAHKLIIISFLALLVGGIEEMAIVNLHGIFGIYELPVWAAHIVSVLLIIFIVNAINLLDGIDGLAGGMGVVILGIFCFGFYQAGEIIPLQMNFSMIAVLIAFLIYNVWINRFKIFMGDSGSLLLGLVLSINLIKYFRVYGSNPDIDLTIAPVSILALFVVPVFDSIHVSIKRLLIGRSPFHPDRNHIHHTYLKLGFSHQGASLVLISYTLFFFFFSRFLLIYINSSSVIIMLLITALFFWHIPEMIIRRNPRKYALRRNRYKNGKNGKYMKSF